MFSTEDLSTQLAVGELLRRILNRPSLYVNIYLASEFDVQQLAENTVSSGSLIVETFTSAQLLVRLSAIEHSTVDYRPIPLTL